MHIRRLGVAETEEAHQLIGSVTSWLKAKNIQQWDRALPLSLFANWVAEESAYGVFESDELLALFVLRRKDLSEYDCDDNHHVLWLSTVCVHRSYAGQGLGKTIMDFVKSIADEDVFLDCADFKGFLPQYYTTYGFVELARKKLYGKQMVLMKWHHSRE